MSSPRAVLLVLGVLVGAIAVAGCGSDESDDKDYVAEAQDVATSFTQSADKLSKQISELEGLNLKSAGELLQTFSDGVDDLAAQIDDISPPDAVEELHTRLVDLLESFGAKAQQAALALRAGDLLGGLPALTSFASEAAQVGGKIDSTVNQIESKLGVE